jgi:Uma2 family endonuclease
MTSLRWTSGDLDLLPEDGKRYEIIDGELYVSRQPSWHHQVVCGRMCGGLDAWSTETGLGAASIAPGVIFADDDDVAPDVVWVSKERLASVLGSDGKLHGAPDLVVEVLSPGTRNERRDREAKLKLYARRGVREYWIVNWRQRQIEVYRRADFTLDLLGTWLEDDIIQSPLLPGFSYQVLNLFLGFPTSVPEEPDLG